MNETKQKVNERFKFKFVEKQQQQQKKIITKENVRNSLLKHETEINEKKKRENGHVKFCDTILDIST